MSNVTDNSLTCHINSGLDKQHTDVNFFQPVQTRIRKVDANNTNNKEEASLVCGASSSYSSAVTERKIYPTSNAGNRSMAPEQHIISLPWGDKLTLPINKNLTLDNDYVTSLEEFLQNIDISNNQLSANTLEDLRSISCIIQKKIDFYTSRNNDSNLTGLIIKTIDFLEEFSSKTSSQTAISENSMQFIKHKAILIYACPEIVDNNILDCFLTISNEYEKFKLEKIYNHLATNIFNNNKDFDSSLSSNTNFAAKYTFGLPKLAAFFFAINYNIKTDKHPTEKIIRRFDEFIQKTSDFFLHAHKVMHDENIVFSDLSESDQQGIIHSSAKFAMKLAKNNLLLEKANFSYLLYTFDSVLGGFFNNLNEIVCFGATELELNRKEEKKHLRMIAAEVITDLYELPEMFEESIKNIELCTADKKLVINNIMQSLQNKIADKIINHLDERIIELDAHLVCHKLMAFETEETSKKADKWRETAKISLQNLDNSIILEDNFMSAFNKKIDFRKAILKGLTEVTNLLYEEIGSDEHFLYDATVARIIHQISTELEKEQATADGVLTAKQLEIIFKRVRHSISSHINNAQDQFTKSLLETCKEYSMNVAADEAKNKLIKDNTNTADNHEMQPITSQAYTSSTNKTTLQHMEEAKKLFAIMLSVHSITEEENDSLSLTERLNVNTSKTVKKYKKNETNIHELTTEEIFNKIHGKKPIVSIKQAFNKVNNSILRPEISRSKTNLAPTENIRKKNHIMMKEQDHETLKLLCQYALQKIKLTMQKLSTDDIVLQNLRSYLDRQIKNIDAINDMRIIDPFKWLINALNTIYESSDDMLALKDDLQTHFNILFKDYNNFLKQNYSNKCTLSWNEYLDSRMNDDNKSFSQIISNAAIPSNHKEFIDCLFKTYDNCFAEVFQSALSQKLPPALETVITYQKIMTFHLGNCNLIQQSQPNIAEFYNIFRLGIIHYNDHLRSLTEQMAFKIYSKPDKNAKKLEQLEKTYKQATVILQNKAIRQMLQDFEHLSSADDTKKMLQQFNNQLDKIFELHFFDKYFGKQSRVFNLLADVVGYCSKNSSFIPGAFVAAAVVNIFFTAPGTNLLRDLQQSTPDLFNAIVSMKQIFLQMQTVVPDLGANAAIAYALPINGTIDLSSCSTDIYQNIGSPVNASFTSAMDTAENNTRSLLQSLYYKDGEGCPSGGKDSFPPGSFINLPNALTTVVSISSGAIACFSGWAKDLDSHVRSVKEYSSLSNVFQDFSPGVTEKLLLASARKLPTRNESITRVYPGATNISEFCLDTLDTLFNKTVKYSNRISLGYALNWSLWVLRYMTLGSCSMAVVKRPHSLEEFQSRVCVAASDRKFKTLIRMLGYNSAKEFIDVFSTKSGTLAFLLFLKEADFFEAINEKAGIADYQVMKAKYNTFLSCMDSLAKNSTVLNSYQVAILKEVYGVELIDNLLGDNPTITTIEKSVQTQINAMLHRIAGITSLGIIYASQCANLYAYTFTPWRIAEQALDKLQGKSVSLSDPVFSKIVAASKKTIGREFTPNHLSRDQTFWHYIFAERASTKYQQSFLLWGIKELINLSMYWNATAHERSMGINTVNWELLGCLVAYLLKDSTGMCARFATLLDNETLRTFFSLLDKLDSPLAEKILSEVGRFGLNSPQAIINMIEAMIEEIMTKSTGDIVDIHLKANEKYRWLERFGLTTFNNVAKIQEEQIVSTIDGMMSTAKQDNEVMQSTKITRQDAKQSPAYYQQLANELRKILQQNTVAHGMPINEQTQQEVASLDQFMQSHAYGIDYDKALELMNILSKLEKISSSAIDAWFCQNIISKVRSLQPQDKTEMRLALSQKEIDKRHTQMTEEQLPEVIVHQPGINKSSDKGKTVVMYV